MRVPLMLLLLMSAMALNFEASLMTHTLEELNSLDTSQFGCNTPQSHFNEMETALTSWAHILENKDKIPKHIETLNEMKSLIKEKKYDQLTKSIESLDLLSEPVLAEIKSKLSGLSSQDKHEREDCTKTLFKLCAYLVSQMNNCKQQCQQSPITVIKVKGKIDDLQVIQAGCGQQCQPPDCEEPEEPSEYPESEESEPISEPSEEPEEPSEPESVPVDADVTEASEPTEEEEESEVDVPEEEDESEIPEDESEVPEDESEVPEDEEEPEIPSEEGPEVDDEDVPSEEEPEIESEPEIPSEEGPEVDDEDVPSEEEPEIESEPEIPSEEGPEVDDEDVPSEEEPEIESEPEIPSEEGPEEVDENEPSEEEPEIPESEVPESEPSEEIPESELSEAPEPESEESEPVDIPEPEPESEESEPVPEEVVEMTCIASESTETFESAFSAQEPVYETTIAVEADQYGFGLYVMGLIWWPERSATSKHFIARLTDGEKTVLGVYISADGIQFVSYDEETSEEVHVNAAFDDFEGDWAHVYISYGKGKAYGVVQYWGEQPILRDLKVQHAEYSQLQLKVGGTDGKFESFQGQYYGVHAVTGPAVVVKSVEEFELYINACNSHPVDECEKVAVNHGNFEFFGTESHFDDGKTIAIETWSNEYAISGWFKWHAIEDQNIWHSVFRLDSNTVNGEEVLMGDRDLAVYIGSEMVKSPILFSTYTYTELNGEGNPNLWQGIPYGDHLTSWHYIYFGYNRNEREAYAYVKFADHEEFKEFKDINHFVVPQKRLFIGQDEFYPSYSGQMQNIHFNSCVGSYSLEPFTEDFGYIPEPHDPEEPEPSIPEEEEPEEPVPSVPEEPEPSIPEEPEPSIPEEPVPSEPEEPEPSIPEEPVPSEPEEPEPSIPEEPVPSVPEEPEPSIPEEPEPTVPEEPSIPEEPEQPEEPKPEPVVPVKPLPPAPKSDCEHTIEVTKDNAADILCALSEYLSQLASGHEPDLGVNPARVCFCLDYDGDSNESFMQIESLLNERDPSSLESLVIQRRRL